MTREQISEMIQMKKDNNTYQEIANKFGISKQRAHQLITKPPAYKRRGAKPNSIRCKYPVLRSYMSRNNLSWRELGEKTGIKWQNLYANFMVNAKVCPKYTRTVADLIGVNTEFLLIKDTE